MRNWLATRFNVIIARPNANPKAAYANSRMTFRWLSGHVRLKTWIVGGTRWSLLIIKDEGGSDDRKISAHEAWERISKGDD